MRIARSAHNAGATVALDDSNTEIADENIGRICLHLVNNSDTAMTIILSSSTAGIVANAGLVLAASGGSFTLDRSKMYTGAVRGRHNGSGGTKNLSIIEF